MSHTPGLRRLTRQEYEQQCKRNTAVELAKLKQSTEYQRLLELRGETETYWNWQIRERLGLPDDDGKMVGPNGYQILDEAFSEGANSESRRHTGLNDSINSNTNQQDVSKLQESFASSNNESLFKQMTGRRLSSLF